MCIEISETVGNVYTADTSTQRTLDVGMVEKTGTGYRIDGYGIDGYGIDGYRIDGYRINGYQIDGYRTNHRHLI